VPLNVTADGSFSWDAGGIVSYQFDFGDGASTGRQAAAVASHQYGASGNYTITLTVVNSSGLTAVARATILVTTPS
jgi:PKD repeat protein